MSIITSKERHELRYQRRKSARAAAKTAKYAEHNNYDEVFTYAHLYDAYKKCRRNVSWKASVQRYISQAPLKLCNSCLINYLLPKEVIICYILKYYKMIK